ncbi:hypothetical protein WR25_15146 [Diploscapter pachys]|uniref:Complex I assembly factor TIMMDC1, mitochondrial n=1 Tax=Diploscapter pachys TaxID=2018661 RepID=A0A2A2K4K4_9BILA|nr:hypothetical protein WR25_15146 [Diploscapter pachys]
MSLEGPSTSQSSGPDPGNPDQNQPNAIFIGYDHENPYVYDEGNKIWRSIRSFLRLNPSNPDYSKPDQFPGMSPRRETLRLNVSSNLDDDKPKTGWQRIKALYVNPPTMEYDLIGHFAQTTFFAGLIFGGLRGAPETERRFELIQSGQRYLSPNDVLVRKMDFRILRFARSGFKFGLLCSGLSIAIVGLVFHTTAYRDQFCSWYFPAYSGVLAGLRSIAVGGALIGPTGLSGLINGVLMGAISGLTLAVVPTLYGLYYDKTADQAYRMFKERYERVKIQFIYIFTKDNFFLK